MNKLLRLVGTAIAVLIAIRLVSWLLSPALPLLISIFFLTVALYIALHGFRRDL
jgi:hypothetical protein